MILDDDATPDPALRCRCGHDRTGRAQRAGLGSGARNILVRGGDAMALTEHNIRRYRVARGTLQEDGASRKIAVRFDASTFNKILSLALASNRCFAEQVRLFVDRGLDSIPQDELDEAMAGNTTRDD